MNRNLGFSLMELLIGMTLLGFLLAILYGGFRLAANSWDATERRTAVAADQEAGRSAIRRLITEAQPFHLRNARGQQPLAFEGRSDSLRLVAPLGQIGPRAVELAIVNEAGAKDLKLVLRHGPVRFEAEQFTDVIDDRSSHKVLGDLSNATFAYFGPEKPGDPPAWRNQWLDQERFPVLIRLHLASSDGTALDLDVAPMISGNRLANMRITAGPQ